MHCRVVLWRCAADLEEQRAGHRVHAAAGRGQRGGFGLIQHATAGQFHVSACSQQALCYYAKNTDEQLGNVKDINKSDCPHCQ